MNLTDLNKEYLQYLRTPHTMRETMAKFNSNESAVQQILRRLRDSEYVQMTTERNTPYVGGRGVYEITEEGQRVIDECLESD